MRDISRRDLLKGLGLTAAASATAGCELFGPDAPGTPRGTGTPERATSERPYTDRFDTVVDLAEAGANTNGQRSVVPLLREHLASDTLVYLPQGEYLMDDAVQFLSFDNAGIVGDRATIRAADGYDSVLFDIGRADRGSNFLVEGIEFDIRAPQTGPR